MRPGPFHAQRLKVIELGEPFFAKHGPKAVFLGRWVSGLRIASAWLAGINGMSWPTFLVWNALGGIVWAPRVGLGVYLLGHVAEDILTRRRAGRRRLSWSRSSLRRTWSSGTAAADAPMSALRAARRSALTRSTASCRRPGGVPRGRRTPTNLALWRRTSSRSARSRSARASDRRRHGACRRRLTVPGARVPIAGVTPVGVVPTPARPRPAGALMRAPARGRSTRRRRGDRRACGPPRPAIYGRYGYGAGEPPWSLTVRSQDAPLRTGAGAGAVRRAIPRERSTTSAGARRRGRAAVGMLDRDALDGRARSPTSSTSARAPAGCGAVVDGEGRLRAVRGAQRVEGTTTRHDVVRAPGARRHHAGGRPRRSGSTCSR